jgi:hypothetical protein
MVGRKIQIGRKDMIERKMKEERTIKTGKEAKVGHTSRKREKGDKSQEEGPRKVKECQGRKVK